MKTGLPSRSERALDMARDHFALAPHFPDADILPFLPLVIRVLWYYRFGGMRGTPPGRARQGLTHIRTMKRKKVRFPLTSSQTTRYTTPSLESKIFHVSIRPRCSIPSAPRVRKWCSTRFHFSTTKLCSETSSFPHGTSAMCFLPREELANTSRIVRTMPHQKQSPLAGQPPSSRRLSTDT